MPLVRSFLLVVQIVPNIGHFIGHTKPCYNAHYGHFINLGHSGLAKYGSNYDRYRCLCKDQKKILISTVSGIENFALVEKLGPRQNQL